MLPSFSGARRPSTSERTDHGLGAGTLAGVGITVPETIVCVDCGGTCHRLGYEPAEGWSAGAVVAYRCADCLDRWDVEFDERDLDEGGYPR